MSRLRYGFHWLVDALAMAVAIGVHIVLGLFPEDDGDLF